MTERNPDDYVHQTEFTAFRSDVISSFERVFSKLDTFSGELSRASKPPTATILSVLGLVLSVVLLAAAGYVAHVSDGHPHRGEDRIEHAIDSRQQAIDDLRREIRLRSMITHLGGDSSGIN